MTRLFLECTIRAALIVVGTAIVLYAMRVKVASVKHRVWTAVLLLMLALPFWIVWGPKAPIRILPANVENFASEVFVQSPAPAAENAQRANSSQTPATPGQRVFSTTEEVLLGLYLLGAFVFLARLAIGTAKANQLVREASVIDGLCTSESCAAPVTVGCFRPTIVLPANWRDWSEARLGVVLAHEREHVRRRDPLVQWLALLNRAVFWFHPAAWWLERELSALAEECCDAAVLAQGHDPEAYAETLMQMARAVMDSGTRVNVTGSAMPGVRLPERLQKIAKGSTNGRISNMRAAGAIAISLAICFAFVAVTLASAQPDRLNEVVAGPQFHVDSIKLCSRDINSSTYSAFAGPRASQGRLIVPCASMTTMIRTAYLGYPGSPYNSYSSAWNVPIRNAPNWLQSEGYSILAEGKGSPSPDVMKGAVLQAILEDRFKLKIRRETQDVAAYALTVAPGGPKLCAASGGNDASPNFPVESPCFRQWWLKADSADSQLRARDVTTLYQRRAARRFGVEENPSIQSKTAAATGGEIDAESAAS
ncbi:MAG TPA: M56 family metallopeptidase [Candidatus Acidoferrales bacterium]